MNYHLSVSTFPSHHSMSIAYQPLSLTVTLAHFLRRNGDIQSNLYGTTFFHLPFSVISPGKLRGDQRQTGECRFSFPPQSMTCNARTSSCCLSGLGLLQNGHDLAVSKTWFFHRDLPGSDYERILFMNTPVFRGDYRSCSVISKIVPTGRCIAILKFNTYKLFAGSCVIWRYWRKRIRPSMRWRWVSWRGFWSSIFSSGSKGLNWAMMFGYLNRPMITSQK